MKLTSDMLRQIIKEEMAHLAKSGDLDAVTESEKMAFQIILEKLSPEQLEDLGLRRVRS